MLTFEKQESAECFQAPFVRESVMLVSPYIAGSKGAVVARTSAT